MADNLIQPVQAQQRQVVMQQRAAQRLPEPTYQESGLDSFITNLSKLTNQVIPVINTELQKKIKVDQVKQTARAFAGLLPSEDATNSGIAAHHLIDVQNGIVDASNNYTTWLGERYKQENPPTQDEIDAKRAEINTELLNKYPDVGNDQIISRFITMKLQESVPVMKAMEVKAKADYFDAQGTKALKSSVADLAKLASVEAIEKAMPAYYSTAIAVGKGKADANKELFEFAKAEAELGSGNLVSVLERSTEFKGDSRIQILRNAYDKAKMGRDVVYIGTEKQRLEEQYKLGNITEAQFDSGVMQLQKTYSYSAVSPAWVEAAKTARSNYIRSQNDELNNANMLLNYSGTIPFKMDSLIPEDVKNKAPAEVTRMLQNQANTMVANGEWTTERAQDYVYGHAASLSESSQLKFPVLQSLFDGFKALDIRSFKGQKLPEHLVKTIDGIGKLSPRIREMYMSKEDMMMYENYQNLRLNNTPEGAFMQLNAIRERPPIDVNSTKVKDAIKNQIDDIFPNSYFGGGKIPKWQEARIKAEAERLTKTNLAAGAMDEKLAANLALRTLSGSYSRVYNNSYINATAIDLGAAGFLVPKDGNLSHFNEALRMWTKDNMSTLQSKSLYGKKLNESNIRFEYNNGLITVFDPYGNMISKGARPASEFHAAFDAEQERRATEQAKKVQAGQAQNWFSQGRLTFSPSPSAFNTILDAQIVHESGGKQFDSTGKVTRSHAGAVGVAQVMPIAVKQVLINRGTYSEENFKAAWHRAQVDEKFNRQVGLEVLQYVAGKFNNELFSSLSAYNAGEGNVRSAISKAKNKYGVEGANYNRFKEFLPKETRDYVHKVSRTLNGKGVMALQPDMYFPKEHY